MEPQPISVVLVEDDAPTRDYLGTTLAASETVRLTAAVGTLAEARAVIESSPPSVLVTDLNLPDGHGNDLIREVRNRWPGVEIMVISVLGDELSVMDAVRAGAAGYILKDARPIDLIVAVEDLVMGRSPISASIARHIIRQTQLAASNQRAEPAPVLTPRETDILWGIAKGFTYNDIADRLAISRNTVPTHIKNIYRKLEVNSRTEAVYAAMERKLIRLVD